MKAKAIALMLLVITAASLGCGKQSQGTGEETAAYVNGEPVSVSEIRFHMGFKRAEVYQYFKEKYGTLDQQGFWRKSFGGEVPEKRLRDTALTSIVNDKLIQMAARDMGIMKDISFQGFLIRWDGENARRKEAIRQNRVVYGPVQLDAKEFYGMELSNGTAAILRELEKRETAEELERYYKLHLSSFITPATKKLQRITVDYPAESKSEAKAVLANLQRNVSDSSSVQKLSSRSDGIQVKTETLTMDARASRETALLQPEQYQIIQSLSPGQPGEIIEEKQRFVLLQVTGQEEGALLPYEQVADSIRSRLAEERYRTMIDNRKKESKVEVVEAVFKGITE